MKERPILFSAPMVRALLAGTKTQTRRIIKPQHLAFFNQDAAAMLSDWNERPLPYGQTGDRLWVRETFGHFERNQHFKPGCNVYYRADGNCLELEPWRPSIHMPRWASRITLEITSVRVERLQDISEADAQAEGVTDDGSLVTDLDGKDRGGTIAAYATLWEVINGVGSWDDNPWVWVVSFKRAFP